MTDIFDLLDESLDNLSDLEKFEPFPAGAHLVTLAFRRENLNEHAVVKMDMTMVETLELASVNDIAPEPGKKVGLSFFMTYTDKATNEKTTNKVGQGQLKEILRVLQETAGGNSPTEIMAAAEGMQVAVTLKVRPDKNDPDIKYNSVKAVALV